MTLEQSKKVGRALAAYLLLTRAFYHSEERLLLDLRWRLLEEAQDCLDFATLHWIAISMEDAQWLTLQQ